MAAAAPDASAVAAVGQALVADANFITTIGQTLYSDAQFVGAVGGELEKAVSGKLEERLMTASKTAEKYFSEAHQRMRSIEQNLVKTLETANANFTTQIEERLKQASQTAEGAFSEVAKRVASLEQDLQQSQDACKDVTKRLEAGGARLDVRHREVEAALGTLNNKVDASNSLMERAKETLKGDFERTKTELRKVAADICATVSTRTHDSSAGHGGKTSRLVTLKETTVDKLGEGITKVDFDNWIDELYVHIDMADGWEGVSHLLKEVRLQKVDLTEETMLQLIDKVGQADNDFSSASFDYKPRDRDLYAYLLRKLNKKLKVLVAGTKSGFELFRRIMREEDPVTESTEYSLRFAFQQLVYQKSSSMEGTRKLLQIMEKKMCEYREKTGKEMDEVLKTTVLHGAMDSETGREMRRNRIELTFDKMKGFIEELYIEEQSRDYATTVDSRKNKTDSMDVGAIHALSGPGKQLKEVDDEDGEHSAGDTNCLDAMNKGRGKGKGQLMECYRCGGFGHPARECPTPEGSAAQHQCFECGGKGHYGRDHKAAAKGDGSTSKGSKGYKGEPGKGGYLSKGMGNAWKGQSGVKGYKGGGKYGPGKGWSSGPRSMNSVDAAMYSMMGQDFEWESQGDYSPWNDMSIIGQAPWQESWPSSAQEMPWQAPRRPGSMSSLARAQPAVSVPVRNRFAELSVQSDDKMDEEQETERNGKIEIRFDDLLTRSRQVQAAKLHRKAQKTAREKRICGNKQRCSEEPCHECGGGSGCRHEHSGSRGETETAEPLGISLVMAKAKGEELHINNVDSGPREYRGWKEIEVTIDSGACDSVMPTNMCKEIPIVESERQRDKMEYEVANGETIPNEGERHCLLMTLGAKTPKRITFQVADVHKALLSITRVADAGYECHLGKKGGFLLDIFTGERVPIMRKGNLYVMKAWVREDQPGFSRQGS